MNHHRSPRLFPRWVADGTAHGGRASEGGSPKPWPRRILTIVGALLLVAGACWVFAPLLPGEPLGVGLFGTPPAPLIVENELAQKLLYAGSAVVYVGLLLITQWLFLLRRGSWRPSLSEGGRPLWLAAVGVAFPATLVSFGLVAGLMEAGGIYEPLGDTVGTLPFLAATSLFWIGWSGFFLLYGRRRDHKTVVGRAMRALIGGTILELLVVTPIHALDPHESSCQCARGSYTGLVFGITAAIWLFGPGIFLLYERERRRRAPLLQQRGSTEADEP